MKRHVLPLIAIAAILSSCASVKTNTYTAKTMDIYGPGVLHKPVVADLEVAPNKLTGTATLSATSSIEVAKELAVNSVLKSAKADVLIEPRFETTSDDKQVTATVTGWPATYKNFRPVVQSDLPLLEAGRLQQAAVSKPAAATVAPVQIKKKTGLWIGLGVVVLAAVAFLLSSV